MVLALYLLVRCLRAGIWDRHFRPNLKTNAAFSLLSGAAVALLQFFMYRSAVAALFVGVVVIGLSWRGLPFNRNNDLDSASNTPATNFGDQLKRGVTDGIIGDPEQREVFQPTPAVEQKVTKETPVVDRTPEQREERRPRLESEAEWKARLKREQDEQYIREAQRQRMARYDIGAPYPWHIFTLDKPEEARVADMKAWMQREGVRELVRTDDPRTGSIILTVHYESGGRKDG